MTNKEILTKVIEKAIVGGWQIPFEEPLLGVSVETDDVEGTPQTDPYIKFELDGSHDWLVGIPGIIFNHGFAKALWGNGLLTNGQVWLNKLLSTSDDCYLQFDGERWQYHLQQMVIADDPIKYLGEHI